MSASRWANPDHNKGKLGDRKGQSQRCGFHRRDAKPSEYSRITLFVQLINVLCRVQSKYSN